MVRVSILMPVRNAGPWLAQAVDSILAQTFADWELLAINDGSTDDSAEILAGYADADSRIRVLAQAPQASGLVAALNHGLGQAEGSVIARMDGDDLSRPERLARSLALLDADPTSWAVGCRVEAVEGSAVGVGMREYLDWQNSLTVFEEMLGERFVESPLLHPTLVMRADVLKDRLNGWADNGWPEDWDLVLRAFEQGLRAVKTPEVLYDWRLHPGQASLCDPIYGTDAFARARAFFLSRHLRAQGLAGPDAPRELFVLGAGPTGKRLAKTLADQGVAVSGFADVDPRKLGGVIRYKAFRWTVVAHEDLMQRAPRPYALSAVGSHTGRARVRAELARYGWLEGPDYLVAA